MSACCSVCNQYPCPGCLGAARDEIDRLKSELAWLYNVTAVENVKPEQRARIDELLRAERKRLDTFRAGYEAHKKCGEVTRCNARKPFDHEQTMSRVDELGDAFFYGCWNDDKERARAMVTDRDRENARAWLRMVNHMTDEQLDAAMQHGEIESLATLLATERATAVASVSGGADQKSSG